MFTSVLCASRFPCQLPSAVTLPAPATNPVCRRTSLSAVSKSYRGRISATERTAPRPPLLKQILVGFLALLLIVQAAGANVLQPEKAKACCQCEADVNEMLSSMYGWIWGSDSQYCKKDFPDVWAGFVDSFTDTLKARGAAVTPAQTQAQPGATFWPAVPRLVAIGDLHGDMDKAQQAFRLGGLIDEQGRWSGGSTTAVQVGDQLDRGDDEVEILYWLERLQREASKVGGALHILNGNHETMNAGGRFRYATRGGVEGFKRWQTINVMADKLKEQCGCAPEAGPWHGQAHGNLEGPAARWSALQPGGPLARRFLVPHPVVLQIGSNLFVHGGVLPEHAQYGLERLNSETAAWLSGQTQGMPEFLGGRSAVVWAREYSTEEAARCDCTALQQALQLAGRGAQRMVVGHTIQAAGINEACGQLVFRIDVGLSHGCGNGAPQVLEILNDSEVRVLSEDRQPMSYSQRVQAKAEEADLRQAQQQQWPDAKEDPRVA